MSLADELLADLEEIEVLKQQEVKNKEGLLENDVLPNKLKNESTTSENGQSVHSVARLMYSQHFADVLQKIDYFQTLPQRTEVSGPVEQDPEYLLIVEANNLTVEIQNEIDIIHKYLRDLYHKRFPELESLVPSSMDYIKTVKELGNNVEKAKSSDELCRFLSPATIMVVSVSASTTQGTEMTENELEYVFEACDMAIQLSAYQQKVFEYVESRMALIAPNMSALLGASTAAKIMGTAGGLTNLSKMPACNILVLGAYKKTSTGFSNQTLTRAGYVYHSDIVQSCPADLRSRIACFVACKCALAARVDSFHSSTDGAAGRKFRSEILHRIDKLTEPPPTKQVKPLPPPIDPVGQRRGGRRARKMKERLGITEMRRQANRMTFGEIEQDAYQEDLGLSLGQLGKPGAGKIRAAQIDAKTKARISQKLQKTLQKDKQAYGGQTTVKKHISGTASSVAFTPLQGLEIVSAGAMDCDYGEKDCPKYFSSTAGFSRVSSIIPKAV